MPKYNIDFDDNPKFNTVIGLTNTTFNPNNIVSGRMVTEQQLQSTWQRIYEDEVLIDRCCRDIVLWEAYVQIVRLNTNSMGRIDNIDFPNAPGTVFSSFYDNVKVGIARRGLPFTVEFPLKWDRNLYVSYTPEANADNDNRYPQSYTTASVQWSRFVQYRFVYNTDQSSRIGNESINGTSYNRANFFIGNSQATNAEAHRRGSDTGRMVNTITQNGEIIWYSFVHNIANDGTVTLRDNRRRTDFDIIRFFTQWCLKQCSDGTVLPEPTFG